MTFDERSTTLPTMKERRRPTCSGNWFRSLAALDTPDGAHDTSRRAIDIPVIFGARAICR
jgi:hypothetical protein